MAISYAGRGLVGFLGTGSSGKKKGGVVSQVQGEQDMQAGKEKPQVT